MRRHCWRSTLSLLAFASVCASAAAPPPSAAARPPSIAAPQRSITTLPPSTAALPPSIAAPQPSTAPIVAAQSTATERIRPQWQAAAASPAPEPPVNTTLAIDTAAVAAAEQLLGVQPLTDAQRRGLYGDGLPYIPATLSSQLEAYGRVRGIVASSAETVAGAGHAPLAVVYAPPEFRPAVKPAKNKTGRKPGVGVTSLDDAPVVSIPPDDTVDDAANWIGDDDGAVAAAPRLLAMLPRLVTWGRDAAVSSSNWRAHRPPPAPPRPTSNETLAYMTALELGALVRARRVTAVELVEVFTARLKSLDPYLEAVAAFTTDAALTHARTLDAEAAAGRFRSPLHGVPFGVKDVIAAAGASTTWGLTAMDSHAAPGVDATVVARLTDAGAVLIAKLATGELAFDDVWFGGHTKNPWNIVQGASGSSAGPAAAVAAAGVPFALGTETQGSLVSPAARCGVTALRPTPGLIPRTGVMPLAESLDKVGPLCRSAADCAAVVSVVRGGDGVDPAARDMVVADPAAVDLAKLTVGVLPSVRGKVDRVVAALRAKGVTVVDAEVKYVTPATDVVTTILLAEGGASFDFWMRSNTARTALRQDFWPPLFRLARFVPAPEYVAAQRARAVLAGEIAAAFGGGRPVDAFLGNGTDLMAASNLVGLASVSVPLSFVKVAGAPPSSPRRAVASVGFFAPPYGDGVALALASAWQAASDAHLQRPPVGNVEDDARRRACDDRSRCHKANVGGWWERGNTTTVPSAR